MHSKAKHSKSYMWADMSLDVFFCLFLPRMKIKLTNGKEKKNWQYSSHYRAIVLQATFSACARWAQQSYVASSYSPYTWVGQHLHLHDPPRFLQYHVWQSSKMLLCRLQKLLSPPDLIYSIHFTLFQHHWCWGTWTKKPLRLDVVCSPFSTCSDKQQIINSI